MIPLKESYNLNNPQDPLNKILFALGEEDPIFFAETILGLHLNPFQKRFLIAFCLFPQILVVTANQVGKTVALAVAHLWYNFYKKGFIGAPELIEKARYETLNTSPVTRQSKECFRYVEEILHSQFSWEEGEKRFVNDCKIGWFWEGKNSNIGRIDFANNSSLFCLSTGEDRGSGLAGKQFPFLSYDECVQSLHLQEELPARIFSRVAKYAGAVILVATPDELARSQQYWFHLFIQAKRAERGEGKSDWHLIEGIYDENIFIPEKKKKEYKARLKSLDPIRYEQVILGKFISSPERMFTPEMVEGIWNEKKDSTSPQENHQYLFCWDWGVADQGDETVGLGLDITDSENAEIVYAYSKQGGDPVELMAMASYLKLEYNDSAVVIEVTDLGGTIFKKMMERLKPISYGHGNKPDALFFLQLRLRNNIRKNLTNNERMATGRIKSYYLPKLENQLSSYKLEDKKIKQDWVMSLAMALWYLEKYKKISQIKVFPLKLYR